MEESLVSSDSDLESEEEDVDDLELASSQACATSENEYYSSMGYTVLYSFPQNVGDHKKSWDKTRFSV